MMKMQELIEDLIRIRDSYGMSLKDRDSMAEACNILIDMCYVQEKASEKKGA